MTRHARGRRRYRNSSRRRVWVFSDVNRDLRPEQIARIITSAGLEQARLEAEAQAQAQDSDRTPAEQPERGEADHA